MLPVLAGVIARRILLNYRVEMEVARRLLRIFRNLRRMRDMTGCAVDLRAERGRALGDLVIETGEIDRKTIEQRMERGEVRALDVPVGDLDLRV
jgi:hypothetical protein